MNSACDENALLSYALGLLVAADAAVVREHVTVCASCSAYLTTFGSEPDHGQRTAADERTATAVDELAALPLDSWERFIGAHRRRFVNVAAIQALIHACEDALDRNPQRALALSILLVESADALVPSLAARTLQALAWTRHATALLRLGRLPEARAAVTLAEERANEVPAADYEHALIAFTAADVLRELGETDEALRKIRAAADVFARYRDDRRQASAREMEAAVLFRRGDYGAAGELFHTLLDGPTADDPLTRGRLAANAAQCFVKTGLHRRALPLFSAAERVFSDLGYNRHVAKIAWGRARTVRATGDADDARSALRSVLQQFEALDDAADCVRVELELAEWSLDADALSEARALCTNAYHRAVRAGMQFEAREALAYLRDAALNERLTVDRAQYVRLFIEQLPTTPHAAFQPPA